MVYGDQLVIHADAGLLVFLNEAIPVVPLPPEGEIPLPDPEQPVAPPATAASPTSEAAPTEAPPSEGGHRNARARGNPYAHALMGARIIAGTS